MLFLVVTPAPAQTRFLLGINYSGTHTRVVGSFDKNSNRANEISPIMTKQRPSGYRTNKDQKTTAEAEIFLTS